jgi:hypothetical protein
MRSVPLAVLAILWCACSGQASRSTEPKASAVVAPGTTTPSSPSGGSSVPAPLAPAPLSFVDVPALHPPGGARLQIGLHAAGAEAALSPVGDIVAIAGRAYGVQLIHVPTGRGLAARSDLACAEPEPLFAGPCDPKLAFSRDGKRLAVWWPLDGKLVQLGVPSARTQLEAKLEGVVALAFLDDGRLVALREGTSYAYDATGARSEFFRMAGVATQVSPDGRQIVVQGTERRIVDVATGRTAAEPPAKLVVDEVQWGADGRTWVASTYTGEGWSDIVAWRANDHALRTLATSREALAKAGGDGVSSSGFAFPAPYDQVYVGMSSGLIGVGLGGERRFRSTWLPALRLERDSVVRSGDGLVVLTERGAIPCPLRLDAGGRPLVGPMLCALRPSMLAFDGDRLLAVPWNTLEVMAFDAKSGALVASRPSEAPAPLFGTTFAALARDPTLAKRIDEAFALPKVERGRYQLSRDGRWLFIGDTANGEAAIVELATLRARTNLPPFLASGDGTRIVQRRVGASDMVDIRTVDGDHLIRSLGLPTLPPTRMALSDAGKVLVAEGEGKLAVIDVDSGRTLFEPPCRTSYAEDLVLAKDGSLLVCDSFAAVLVYDLRSHKLVKRIEHDPDSVDTFALSDDNRRLAIANGFILVLDL